MVALLASLFITPFIRDWAKRKGWVDYPDGIRKIHTHPIPRIGGLALFLTLIIALIPIFFLSTAPALYLKQNIRVLGAITGLAVLMMLIGLWDDLKNVTPWKKFLAQSLVAFLCWLLGFRILAVWAGEAQYLQWGLSLPLTVLWIVFITNAFNLIDGMDGLAAGAALFATAAILVVSVVGNAPLSSLLLFALTGAIVGFLRYNFSPASIFLGDSGSYFLGFLLAILAIRGSQKSTAALAIAVPLVALGLPVVDTGLAIARRFVRGKPIFSADKRHIHHILLQRGFAPRHAVIFLYGISGLFGLVSLLFINPESKTSGVILAMLGICVMFGIQQLHYPELRGLRAHLSRGIQNQRRLLAASVIVDQLIEKLQEAENLNEIIKAIESALEEMCFSKFELILPISQSISQANLNRRWELIPTESEETIFRWTLGCKDCEQVQKSKAGRGFSAYLFEDRLNRPPCESCSEIKNPILQRYMLSGLCSPAASKAESQLVFPILGRGDSELGMIKFYHPVEEAYPVSAVSIMSQNLGQEIAKAVQRNFPAR